MMTKKLALVILAVSIIYSTEAELKEGKDDSIEWSLSESVTARFISTTIYTVLLYY